MFSCLATDLDDWHAYPASVLAARLLSGGRTDQRPRCARPSPPRSAAPALDRADFRSHAPGMIRRDHAAWITAIELFPRRRRTAARSAARPARDAGRTSSAPAEISFTAARRAAITTAAPAPLPPACPCRGSPRPDGCLPSATWADDRVTC